ncbi:hypothetical protein RH728_000410 [Vibrio vulnificus]|uniref:nucleoid-associated protein n=1 Tax=Vibrio vulnificus TaxID=672 RepID=UPI000C79A090|nr:nucleoid-associated protein [Vibrio vulnificus]EGQ8076802.1 nucleoid-associated protein [Vibrio vulnificus]EHK9046758.1 hypothetical protein [Vibrio vulnificus]EHK9064814.1 hypothetical protein [Vibrio vulnificus]EJO2019139.1 hypothetical protein [Vibrio vulnificus]EKA6048588.1 hypothetical protein [Vibrio vulnificus]
MSDDILVSTNELEIPQENPIETLRIYDLEHGVGYKKSDIDLSQNADLLSFLIKLSQETMNSNSSRAYTFNEEAYVESELSSLLDDPDLHSTNIADHLYEAEEKSRFKTSDGSFIIAKLKTDQRHCYLLTKLDFKKYFEEKTYKLKSGLPEDKAILKSCLVNINQDESFQDAIYLTDKNGAISFFWHTDFLDATPQRNNETNTKEVFDLVGRLLRSKVKKVSEADYFGLKDCVNSYFNTKEVFNFDEFIDETIDAYTPLTEGFTVEDLVSNLREAKSTREFDGSFEIDKTYIKKKIKETITVNAGVTLIIQGSTNDIIYEVTHNDKDYIMIENNSPRGRFNRKELD